MSTNAIFNWIPQAGILVQEVWYGKLSVVGSTLPPATGWNAGANLYSAIANNATFNNLEENTKYRFLVRSHCSTGGDSAWAEYDDYKLVCPTFSATSTATSINVSLSILNSIEFSSIVTGIKIDIIPITSGVPVASSTLLTPFTSSLSNNFTSLTPSTNFNVVISLIVNGITTICSTNPISTPANLTCPVLTYTVDNVTTTSFDITPTNLTIGDNYDLSIDNGVSYITTALTGPTTIGGRTPGQRSNVVLRRNCSNGLSSTTTNQPVFTLPANLSVSAAYGVSIVGISGMVGLPSSYATLNLPSGSSISTHVDSLQQGILNVQVSGNPVSTPANIQVIINGVSVACISVTGTGYYTMFVPAITSPDTMNVGIHLGGCP